MGRPGLGQHPKFLRLAHRLKSKAMARGVLELLWDVAYQSGNEVLGDHLDVQLACDLQQEDLASILVETGFLDQKSAGVFSVHDLWDHAPAYVGSRAKREAERLTRGQTIRLIRSEAGRRGGKIRAERIMAARENGTHTKSEWEEMLSILGACVRCGATDRHLTKDHVVPIYQGGSDGIDNLQPLCAPCNSQKGPDSTDHRIKFMSLKSLSIPSKWLASDSKDQAKVPSPSPSPSPNKEERESVASAPSFRPPEKIREAWNGGINGSSLPRWEFLKPGSKRWKAAEIRWREHPEVIFWERVIKKLHDSDFCTGKNERSWRANPDFLLRPGVAERVLEGSYDNGKAAGRRGKQDEWNNEFTPGGGGYQ